MELIDWHGTARNDGLSADGSGGVWVGPYAHWNGRKWINLSAQVGQYSGFADHLAAIPGTRSMWLAASMVRDGRFLDSTLAISGKLP